MFFQLDIINAFLYGDLHDEVYMQQPLGFAVEGESLKLCKLHEAIYGPKQSHCTRFHKLSERIWSYGFTCSSVSFCLHIPKFKRHRYQFLATLIISFGQKMIKEIKNLQG